LTWGAGETSFEISRMESKTAPWRQRIATHDAPLDHVRPLLLLQLLLWLLLLLLWPGQGERMSESRR
jgi:hypothetical protein